MTMSSLTIAVGLSPTLAKEWGYVDKPDTGEVIERLGGESFLAELRAAMERHNSALIRGNVLQLSLCGRNNGVQVWLNHTAQGVLMRLGYQHETPIPGSRAEPVELQKVVEFHFTRKLEDRLKLPKVVDLSDFAAQLVYLNKHLGEGVGEKIISALQKVQHGLALGSIVKINMPCPSPVDCVELYAKAEDDGSVRCVIGELDEIEEIYRSEARAKAAMN